MKKLNLLVYLLLVVTLVFSSCKKSDNDDNGGSDEDYKFSYSCLNTYLFSSCFSDPLQSISDRFKNQSNQLNGNNVDAVVITESDVYSLSEYQLTEIRKVMAKGGVIVVMSPTIDAMNEFSESIIEDWNVFGDANFNYYDVIEGLENFRYIWNGFDKQFENYKAIAFCGDNILVFPNFGSNKEVEFITLSVDMETREVVDSTKVASYEMVNTSIEYDIDAIIKWMNKSVEESRIQLRDGGTDIKDMGKIITIPLNFDYNTTLLGKHYVGLKENFVRHINQRFVYRVWSVYDLANQKDIYLIHRDVIFEGSALKPEPTDPGSWLQDVDGKKRYYGPFLTGIEVKTEFSDPSCEMLDVQPQNPMTSTTYSEGFSWGINAGLTLSSNPGLNIGGGITLSTQQSTTVPDLQMSVVFDYNKPFFKYEPHWPEKWPEGHFVGDKHDIAVDNIKSDLDLSQKWIYLVKPNDNSTYSIKDSFSNRIDFLYSKTGFFENIDSYYGIRYNWSDFRVDLPAPPRAVQEWRMFCETADTELVRFLSESYKNYFYDSPFKIATATASDMQPIDLFIKDFENHLNNDRALWKSRGFTGTYTFVWKQTNTPDVYTKTTFTVE